MSRVTPVTAEQQSQADDEGGWDGGNAEGDVYDESGETEGGYAWDDDDAEVEVRLTREQLINHISRRRHKFKHLAQLPYTLCMLVVYSAALFAHMDISTVHDMSKGITDPLLALEFGDSPRKTFADVQSEADFWDWMDEGLLPLLFNLTAAEENEILGVVNGVPVYASSVRTVPAISIDAVTVISVTAATRTFLGIQSFAEMGYSAG
eukprot:COSAG01_NODE_23246_length_822_cov_1.239281_1_plen_206_part_10